MTQDTLRAALTQAYQALQAVTFADRTAMDDKGTAGVPYPTLLQCARAMSAADAALAAAPQAAPSTERDHFDLARWHRRLGELADAYYATGNTSPARERARAALLYHALDAATGWHARSVAARLASPPEAAVPVAWISVEDRLPEVDSGEVLVWLTGGRCAFDEWHTHREDPTGMGGPTMDMGAMWRDYEYEEITHWMPLPAPPNQAQGEPT
jgi:hypothetical protein